MEDFFRTFADIVKGLEDPGRASEILVAGAWSKCLSGHLVSNVVPVRLEKKKLIAGVRDELWRRNVADLGPEIARRLNASLGAELVEFVEFQVVPEDIFDQGPAHRNDLIGEEEWSAAADGQITDGLRTAADSIKDEGLRDLFLAAAGSSLARRTLGPGPVVKRPE